MQIVLRIIIIMILFLKYEFLLQNSSTLLLAFNIQLGMNFLQF